MAKRKCSSEMDPVKEGSGNESRQALDRGKITYSDTSRECVHLMHMYVMDRIGMT